MIKCVCDNPSCLSKGYTPSKVADDLDGMIRTAETMIDRLRVVAGMSPTNVFELASAMIGIFAACSENKKALLDSSRIIQEKVIAFTNTIIAEQSETINLWLARPISPLIAARMLNEP